MVRPAEPEVLLVGARSAKEADKRLRRLTRSMLRATEERVLDAAVAAVMAENAAFRCLWLTPGASDIEIELVIGAPPLRRVLVRDRGGAPAPLVRLAVVTLLEAPSTLPSEDAWFATLAARTDDDGVAWIQADDALATVVWARGTAVVAPPGRADITVVIDD